MLVNPAGRVFAGQRIDSDGDAWQMPQGGIDEGETPREAALRELGRKPACPPTWSIVAKTTDWLIYDLPADLVPKILERPISRPDAEMVPDALSRPRRPDRDRHRHPEFSAWKWVGPGAAGRSIVPFKRAVYAKVLEEFAAKL